MSTNVQKLAIAKMSAVAIPAGGGFAAGIAFLSDPARIRATAKAAQKWAAEAIAVMRTAADPNPYKNATDEEIAGVILGELERRKRECHLTLASRTSIP